MNFIQQNKLISTLLVLIGGVFGLILADYLDLEILSTISTRIKDFVGLYPLMASKLHSILNYFSQQLEAYLNQIIVLTVFFVSFILLAIDRRSWLEPFVLIKQALRNNFKELFIWFMSSLAFGFSFYTFMTLEFFWTEQTKNAMLSLIFSGSSVWALYKNIELHKVTLQGFKTKGNINIYFGDVFDTTSIIGISVNEFFDSKVGSKHAPVSNESLHGMFIKNYFKSSSDFDKSIEPLLKGLQSTSITRESAKTESYEIGTTIHVSVKDKNFLLVALCKTEIDSNKHHRAHTNIELYSKAIICMLDKFCELEDQIELSIPLMGSGLGDMGIDDSKLLDLLLLLIWKYLNNKVRRENVSINIILAKSQIHSNKFDLRETKRHWAKIVPASQNS